MNFSNYSQESVTEEEDIGNNTYCTKVIQGRLYSSSGEFAFEVKEFVLIIERERFFISVSLLEINSPVVGPDVFPTIDLLEFINTAK